MPYCGVLDGLTEIDGQPVDLSRLDEGIIIAGDEEYDADDFITDEDKLAVFNATALRTKESLIKEIDSLITEINNKSGVKTGHSPAFYESYKAFVSSFRDEIKKRSFPEKLEDWWRYEYEVRESGITLTLNHIDYYSIGSDWVGENIDTSFELIHIKAKLLTVEQYAHLYRVTTTAVRQWIRRGKIRTAIKIGSEWRIPELAEIVARGYKSANYTRKDILVDVPKEYAFINEYDYITIEQNTEHKELFDVLLSKEQEGKEESECKEIQMDLKERERFELYLISNPFVVPQEECLASRNY